MKMRSQNFKVLKRLVKVIELYPSVSGSFGKYPKDSDEVEPTLDIKFRRNYISFEFTCHEDDYDFIYTWWTNKAEKMRNCNVRWENIDKCRKN